MLAHGLTAAGTTGVIRWGYHVAAELGAWRLTVAHAEPTARSAPERMITATVIRWNLWTARQSPLVLEVPRPKGPWRFPILALEIGDRGCVARLGPIIREARRRGVEIRAAGNGQSRFDGR